MRNKLLALTLGLVSLVSYADDFKEIFDHEITLATCKTKIGLTNKELLREFNKLSDGRKREIFNVLIPDNKSPADCHNVLCSLQKTFGEREGLQLAYMYDRFHFNGSHIAYKESSPLRSDEMDDIILAASDLPEEMFPLKDIQQMSHFTRGKIPLEDGFDENSIAFTDKAEIVLLDTWTMRRGYHRQGTIIHEFAHAIADSILNDIDKSDEWLSLSGWEKKVVDGRVQYEVLPVVSFITAYASWSPIEDFAETFEAYRYLPHDLKTQFPEKYEFMKNHLFHGKEFLENECDSKLTQKEIKLINKLMSKSVQVTPSQLALEHALESCPMDEKLKSCLTQIAKDEVMKFIIEAASRDDYDPFRLRHFLNSSVSVPDNVYERLKSSYVNFLADIVGNTVASRQVSLDLFEEEQSILSCREIHSYESFFLPGLIYTSYSVRSTNIKFMKEILLQGCLQAELQNDRDENGLLKKSNLDSIYRQELASFIK